MIRERGSGSSRDLVRGDEGFTLVEVMIIVAIIGMLLLIAVASYVPAAKSASAAACRQNQRVLEKAFCVASVMPDAEQPEVLADLSPYVAHYDSISTCPDDDAPLVLIVATGDVSCPNHP